MLNKYEDWFKKEQYSRSELALLLVGISPSWEFGQDILRICENDSDQAAYESFLKKYKAVSDHWETYEAFLVADRLIFESQNVGFLKSKLKKIGPIRRADAIGFAIQTNKETGHRFDVFMRAAMAADESTPDSHATADVTADWKIRIQAEAAKQWLRAREIGAAPSKNNLAPGLARWCRENDIRSTQGVHPQSSYIARHVLRDWIPPAG